MKRLLLFAALIAWSGMASAVVYKWVDAQGKLQYGDRPPDGVHAEVVELLGTHVAARRFGAAAVSAACPLRHGGSPQRLRPPKLDDTKAAVAADVAQTRDKQCTDAQDRYKKLIEGRRIYKTGPDGERQYMSSAGDRHRAAQRQARHRYDLQQHDLTGRGGPQALGFASPGSSRLCSLGKPHAVFLRAAMRFAAQRAKP